MQCFPWQKFISCTMKPLSLVLNSKHHLSFSVVKIFRLFVMRSRGIIMIFPERNWFSPKNGSYKFLRISVHTTWSSSKSIKSLPSNARHFKDFSSGLKVGFRVLTNFSENGIYNLKTLLIFGFRQNCLSFSLEMQNIVMILLR